jgi:hypothetical protein
MSAYNQIHLHSIAGCYPCRVSRDYHPSQRSCWKWYHRQCIRIHQFVRRSIRPRQHWVRTSPCFLRLSLMIQISIRLRVRWMGCYRVRSLVHVWVSHLSTRQMTILIYSVESQGRTLEQLEWVYNQPNPVKASLKVDKVIVQADGRVTEKVEL